MERTRLRELTQCLLYLLTRYFLGRNGAYPIKGIDTNQDTSYLPFLLQVEMERTRLRELTPFLKQMS